MPGRDEALSAPLPGRGARPQGRPRRRSEYVTRDLTRGSVPRNLWFLAWPQVVEGFLNVVDQVADLFWAGRYVGAQALAGIGVSQHYTQLVMTGRMGLDMGMQAMIARAIGSGQAALANHIALQAFSLTIIFSVLMATVGVFFAEDLLSLLGIGEDVVNMAALYLQIQFVGFGTQALRMMAGSALQAAGDPLTPMKATMLSRVAHLILSPLLFFGPGPVPDMGVAGLAAGNIVAQVLGVVWNFHALFTGASRLHLTLRGYYVDFPLLRRLVRIGGPAALTALERGLVNLLMVPIVAPFGDYAVAAYALTRRLEMATMMGAMGLGRASGTLVGQSLGAGLVERARETILWALGYVTLIRGGITVLLILFPTFFIGIFSSDPELADVAANWVRIQAVGGLVMGAGMVFAQSFNVAGATVAPMIVTLITMGGVQLPLAYGLSHSDSTDPSGRICGHGGTRPPLPPLLPLRPWLRAKVLWPYPVAIGAVMSNTLYWVLLYFPYQFSAGCAPKGGVGVLKHLLGFIPAKWKLREEVKARGEGNLALGDQWPPMVLHGARYLATCLGIPLGLRNSPPHPHHHLPHPGPWPR